MPPGKLVLKDLAPLLCASLPDLILELESVARELSLPWDADKVEALARHYSEDAWLSDSDPHIQAFLHAVTAARIATERQQPLWMVK
jgi:hypothetical protein